MRTGDLVELRPPAEILVSLDSDACMDGLPFMPEMLGFYGRSFKVGARLERACDTHEWSGTRRFENSVTLDDLRCDGSGHDGCAARCRLFWREAWLRQVANDTPDTSYENVADPALADLERRCREGAVRSRSASERIYRCQATELLRASHAVRWWSPSSLLREVTSGNVGVIRFVRVMSRAVGYQVRKRVLRREVAPHGHPSQRGAASESVQGLSVGQRVRVRTSEEIATTLDASGKTRGLRFDFPEMAPYCGRTARVLARVDRFIDEPSGRMVELKTDAYLLDGFACSGDHAPKRWFCPRAIYAWWREAWL